MARCTLSSFLHFFFTNYRQDGNTGLVRELTKYLPRFFVIGLQKTYSAIHLSQVAQWLSQKPDEIHDFIEELVASGLLNASIDYQDGPNQGPVLRFFSNSAGPLAKTEEEYHAKLVEQTNRTNAMVDHVKLADRRVTLTKEYIESARKKLKNKDADGPVGGDDMDMDPEWTGYQDEDLMLDT